jgi:protein-L-isoaspartate(D-aspartate) O-methyltransferase
MAADPHKLVELLKRSGRLNNPLYEEAFARVHRHLFLPEFAPDRVYVDEAIVTKLDKSGYAFSSSSQPSMMIQMFEQMGLAPGMNVLEIGTGSGYNAALMQHIVSQAPGGRVTTVEIDNDIARRAERALHRAGYASVLVVEDDGAAGYSPRASYDRILVTAGLWDLSAAWVRQLKSNGVLVAPVQVDGFQASGAFRFDAGGALVSTQNLPCRFVYMRGIGAPPELTRRVGSSDLRLIGEAQRQLDTAQIHSLLSDDPQLESQLVEAILSDDFWSKFAPYAILNPPADAVVTLYYIDESIRAYGMEGTGVALFTPGSACFVPDDTIGRAFNFGGADAFLMVSTLVQQWREAGRPGVRQLNLRFVPAGSPPPDGVHVLPRVEHDLHAWFTP